MHTDLQVGMYWGDMGVDFWDSSTWKQQVDKYEVSFPYFGKLHNKFLFGQVLWLMRMRFIVTIFSSPFHKSFFSIKSCLPASLSLMICHHMGRLWHIWILPYWTCVSYYLTLISAERHYYCFMSALDAQPYRPKFQPVWSFKCSFCFFFLPWFHKCRFWWWPLPFCSMHWGIVFWTWAWSRFL